MSRRVVCQSLRGFFCKLSCCRNVPSPCKTHPEPCAATLTSQRCSLSHSPPMHALHCMVSLTAHLSASLLHMCFVLMQDLSAKFAGIIFGLTNGLSSIVEAFSIYGTGLILDSRHSWPLVFEIVAGVNVLGGLFYIFFASSKPQSW